jgi:hypothetical protein
MRLSPDGYFYLAAARREPVPRPYAHRWLLPFLLGPDPRRWAALTYVSLLATPAAAWFYFGAMGLVGWPRAFATALLCVLPGVRACSLRYPVLVDAASFLWALSLAEAAKTSPAWFVIPWALIGGAMNEKVPIFAALWSWSPLPLVGLLGVGWSRPHALTEIPWLAHPAREAWKLRRALGLDGSLYLRPFGAALAGLAAPSWQLVATVLVAHTQLLAAQDTIRLTVWCAPVLVLGAARTLPPALWPLAVLVTAVHRDDRV